MSQVLTRKTIYRNTNLYKSTTEQNPLPINRISLAHLLPQLTLTNQQNENFTSNRVIFAH